MRGAGGRDKGEVEPVMRSPNYVGRGSGERTEGEGEREEEDQRRGARGGKRTIKRKQKRNKKTEVGGNLKRCVCVCSSRSDECEDYSFSVYKKGVDL